MDPFCVFVGEEGVLALHPDGASQRDSDCQPESQSTRLARAEAGRVAGWPGGGTLRARASCTFTMNTAERHVRACSGKG